MKTCPICQTNYTDDTLRFCLEDGTQLTDLNAQNAPTVFLTDSETLVSPKRVQPLEQITIPRNWEESQVTRVSSINTEPKKNNTTTAVLITIAAMFLLFGLVGFGAWVYLKDNKNEVAQNKNSSSANLNFTTPNLNSNLKPSPTPTVVSKTPNQYNSPTPQATVVPPTNFDPEQVKNDVSAKIYSWKSMAESRNLNAYMSNYADSIDYYNKSGASNGFVRSDKQKAFTKFDNIKITLTNMLIKPNETGDTATAVFDKEWIFEGPGKYNAGKVQTQLRLQKIAGDWRINGERDLKVYYVDR